MATTIVGCVVEKYLYNKAKIDQLKLEQSSIETALTAAGSRRVMDRIWGARMASGVQGEMMVDRVSASISVAPAAGGPPVRYLHIEYTGHMLTKKGTAGPAAWNIEHLVLNLDGEVLSHRWTYSKP